MDIRILPLVSERGGFSSHLQRENISSSCFVPFRLGDFAEIIDRFKLVLLTRKMRLIYSKKGKTPKRIINFDMENLQILFELTTPGFILGSNGGYFFECHFLYLGMIAVEVMDGNALTTGLNSLPERNMATAKQLWL